ncbi:hypothetical protein [Paenibacillus hamazuiensis]|uniref:hypothetical protein n=1 Tax=Paenibacillus hamazuiensis TaxID=2936508 RepID=UPI00200D58E2|nr:hypothetical protein [Paenibacillus hamazuiensis]
MQEDKLGIVVLFNSGLNAFVDYHAFVDGLAGLLTGHPGDDSVLSGSMIEAGMGIVILATAMAGIRDFLRIRNREETWRRRPKWLSILLLAVRLVPLLLLAFIPQIITWLGGGRVIGWQGILMMMPSVIVWLVLASAQNMAIVCLRAVRFVRRRSNHIPKVM